MVGKMLILFAGLAFSGMASAGFFDGIKKNLEIVNETLDGVNQQVDDISQEVNDINQQVDDLDAEFDEIQTQTTSLGKSRGSGEAGRRAGAGTSSTLDVSQFTHDDYSFNIKRIRLGETFLSLKGKYPGAKMMGQNPASYLPDPANENLRVKIAGDANGAQYVSTISLRQDLGISTRSTCESRAQSLETKLMKKYGADAKKTVKKGTDDTSYFIIWVKAVPGSSGHSRLYSKATCSNDASGNLNFTLVAKGEYIEEVMAARQSRGGGVIAQEMEADF